jgi:hypothetical protein
MALCPAGRGAPFERATLVLAVWGGLGWLLQRILWRRGLRQPSVRVC